MLSRQRTVTSARRRRWWPNPWPALLALCVLAVVVPARSYAEVVERILAVVDGRPLTLSEVRLLARVRGEDEKAALAALIDERLMFRDASACPRPPSPRRRRRGSWPGCGKNWSGGTGARGRAAPAGPAQLSIVKYVEFRFRPQVRIDDEAVRHEYDSRYAKETDAPPLAAVAEEIQAGLAEQSSPPRSRPG